MSALPPVDAKVDHVAGSLSADFVLVEYGDFQCPYCGAAYYELKKLQQTLGDRLCLVFRHFPLTQAHPHALKAAQFAQAAGTVGKFWEMHDLLFENQDALGDASLVGYAKVLQLDDALIKEASGDRFEAAVRHDFRSGVRAGVNGTACLFINGSRYNGPAQSDELLQFLGA
jgi:protein-disulfide isomerase